MGKHMWRIVLLMSVLIGAMARAETPVVPNSKAEITLSFAPVVAAAAPAVVNIYATKQRRGRSLFDDPFFRQFRGFGMPRQRLENSLGSGVILSDDGIAVTNFHVVENATDIRVVLADRREFDAEILLSDAETDIAILRLKNARALPHLEIRDAPPLNVGDLVLAIGNPFGVGQTVTSGIISGLARSGGQAAQGGGYFIQTDTAINPGNSGGALVDMSGRLVGVNTMILTRSGGSNGIGFAVPGPLVAVVADQARSGQRNLIRPWSGIAVQMVDYELSAALEQVAPAGVLIRDMHPDSAFARAGFRIGDVILAVNDAAINSDAELDYHLLIAGAGADVGVAFLRDGAPLSARLRVTPPGGPDPDDMRHIDGQSPLAGVSVARITPGLIAALDLPVSQEGIVIVSVDGFARRLGFAIGDVVSRVNGRDIRTLDDMSAAATMRADIWSIEVLRDGQRLHLRFRF